MNPSTTTRNYYLTTVREDTRWYIQWEDGAVWKYWSTAGEAIEALTGVYERSGRVGCIYPMIEAVA